MLAFLSNFDQSLLLFFHHLTNPFLTWMAWLITSATKFGLCWWILAIILGIRRRMPIAGQLVLVLAFAILEAALCKTMLMRPRPELFADASLNLPMHEVGNTLAEKYSFPSGHTLITSAVAFLLLFKSRNWLALAAILFALLVGMARIYQGLHWPSDVIAGFLLGLPPALLTAPAWQFISTRWHEIRKGNA